MVVGIRRYAVTAGAEKNVLNLSHPTVDIAITCSNFAESLDFYHKKLGFEIVLELEIPETLAREVGLAPTGFRQVRLKAGNTLIKLMDIESPPPTPTEAFPAGVRWLTFFVEDIEKTVDILKQSGVEFLSEPVSAPDAAGVACAPDPDGILIELVQI